MRRSVSCPRSISAHLPSRGDVRPFSSQQVIPLARPTSASRSHSLNRASSYMRHLPPSHDASSASNALVVSYRLSAPSQGRRKLYSMQVERGSAERMRRGTPDPFCNLVMTFGKCIVHVSWTPQRQAPPYHRAQGWRERERGVAFLFISRRRRVTLSVIIP